MSDELNDLETPAVVIERAALDRNLDRAAALATAGGVALRPHIKTHKSLAIARLQVAGGAAGLTTAKPSEAAVFLAAGFRDVTVAFPVVDHGKAARLAALAADRGARLRIVADSPLGVAALAAAAEAAATTLEVMVKVDVGLHRCGVDPGGDAAGGLARAIGDDARLVFGGLISHAGHVYRAAGPQEVRAIAEDERRLMTGLAGRLRAAGIAVPAVSVGSTPTVLLGERLDGVTEVRPGNYVFMDLTQVAIGVAAREDLALTVVATVVSSNDRFAIVDAGSKTLSSDRGPHGSSAVAGYGLARPLAGGPDTTVVSLSEEHGFLAQPGTEGGGPAGPRFAVGERVRIWPNHACTVANLARTLHVVGPGGAREEWPVDAAARVL